MTKNWEDPDTELPPTNDFVTDYDRRHLKLYARLLDADAAGASLGEIARILFGIDERDEPERAQQLHRQHLQRARWMTENGYRSLLTGQNT